MIAHVVSFGSLAIAVDRGGRLLAVGVFASQGQSHTRDRARKLVRGHQNAIVQLADAARLDVARPVSTTGPR